MNQNTAMKLFKFDRSDLSANRNGHLSERQAKRLSSEAKAERKSARDSMVILLIIASLGLGMGLLIALNAPTWTGRILIGLTLCLLWPIAWGWKAWTVIKSAPDTDFQIKAARGPAHIIRVEDEFMLEVGDRQFDLEKNPSNAISDGDELVVFYLERTEEILSVEAL